MQGENCEYLRTLKEKLPIFLINTLQLHIPLLALTDRQNDRWRHEYTRCAWAGGTFFQLCCCVSFLVVVGNNSQNENTFLQKKLIGLLYYDPPVYQKYQDLSV